MVVAQVIPEVVQSVEGFGVALAFQIVARVGLLLDARRVSGTVVTLEIRQAREWRRVAAKDKAHYGKCVVGLGAVNVLVYDEMKGG